MNIIGNQNLYIKLHLIEKKLQKLETKCDDIDKKCDMILELLKDNSKDCKKMSSHIDFIDNVYDNVRAPLNFVCDSINNKFIRDN
jgi:hypothetical protein